MLLRLCRVKEGTSYLFWSQHVATLFLTQIAPSRYRKMCTICLTAYKIPGAAVWHLYRVPLSHQSVMKTCSWTASSYLGDLVLKPALKTMCRLSEKHTQTLDLTHTYTYVRAKTCTNANMFSIQYKEVQFGQTDLLQTDLWTSVKYRYFRLFTLFWEMKHP